MYTPIKAPEQGEVDDRALRTAAADVGRLTDEYVAAGKRCTHLPGSKSGSVLMKISEVMWHRLTN